LLKVPNHQKKLAMPSEKEMAARGGDKLPVGPFAGPSASRSCTDVFFLLLFIAFWGGMIAIAVVAFRDGRPDR
jgi:hypothetical protein